MNSGRGRRHESSYQVAGNLAQMWGNKAECEKLARSLGALPTDLSHIGLRRMEYSLTGNQVDRMR